MSSMLPAQNGVQVVTMSSREIAILCDKEHRNVKRDIVSTCEQLGVDVLSFERIYHDQLNRPQTEFVLDKSLTLTIVSGYSVKLRHRIVTRLEELESQYQAPAKTLDSISRKDLALMLLESEEEKERLVLDKQEAQQEAERLNHVCNVVTRQFVAGQTAAAFCKTLNGVNTQEVQSWLASRGHLINEGKYGFRPSCQTRDKYFKESHSTFNNKMHYQAQLTQKGCKWLYKKYLKTELPMKAGWDGEFTHAVFEGSNVVAIREVA